MTILLKIASLLGLVLTIGPAILVFFGVIDWPAHAALMLAGAILWFATAPLWIRSTRAAAP